MAAISILVKVQVIFPQPSPKEQMKKSIEIESDKSTILVALFSRSGELKCEDGKVQVKSSLLSRRRGEGQKI